MTASESENGGFGRGKSLAWRSRSGKDMAASMGRDAGSESGRDFGRNIANWWTSAVEQTSTFLMDEVLRFPPSPLRVRGPCFLSHHFVVS